MAALRGTLQGMRGEVSRLGSKNSGITASLNTWLGKVTVDLNASGMMQVYIVPNGQRSRCVLNANIDTGEIYND